MLEIGYCYGNDSKNRWSSHTSATKIRKATAAGKKAPNYSGTINTNKTVTDLITAIYQIPTVGWLIENGSERDIERLTAW